MKVVRDCVLRCGELKALSTQLMTEQAEWINEPLVSPEQIFVNEP